MDKWGVAWGGGFRLHLFTRICGLNLVKSRETSHQQGDPRFFKIHVELTQPHVGATIHLKKVSACLAGGWFATISLKFNPQIRVFTKVLLIRVNHSHEEFDGAIVLVYLVPVVRSPFKLAAYFAAAR